ncbi:hypothetical protein K7X08_000395 [Anisodus acutangulus]|uniref:Uncharacterized protein n=1 Tax=Anisodus acutangulus TaxID=402998 RepID=A0A9Q1M3F1_9SOLA|nr:hypothetical protein K7X08_000395 [Anisodus acutangulus]
MDPIKYFTFSMIISISGEALDCLVAACDAGRGSSSGPLDLSPASEPELRHPEPEVAPIPRAVLVSELEQPLLTDIQRRAELQQRLAFYFIRKNERMNLLLFLRILEKQVLLEKMVEAALVRNGFLGSSLAIGAAKPNKRET